MPSVDGNGPDSAGPSKCLPTCREDSSFSDSPPGLGGVLRGRLPPNSLLTFVNRSARFSSHPAGIPRHGRRVPLPADHGNDANPMTPIPDNVEGALLISIIDFVLSFVIISGIGVILAILPLVNRYWVIDEKDLKGGH